VGNNSFLLQPLKSFVKASKVSFKLFGKIISKKRKGGRRCWADPPPFRPSQTARPGFPSLSLPRADARLRHPTSATWRPYVGVVDAPRPIGLNLVETPPRAPRPLHSVPSPLPSPSSAHERSIRSNSAAAPTPESSAAHRRPRQ